MRRPVRGTSILAVGITLLAAWVGPVVAPARAQAEPTVPTAISVEPSTGLADGQQVDVTVDGTTDGLWLAMCEGDVSPDASVDELFTKCGREWVIVPGDRPVTAGYTVRRTFQSANGRYITCAAAPGCVISVTNTTGGGLLTAPVELVPGPLELVTDRRYSVREGQELTVTVAGARDVALDVALCSQTVVDTRTVVGGPCGPVQSVPAGTETAQRTVVVDRTFVAADGSEVHCAALGCVVAAASSDGSVFLSNGLTFEPSADLLATPSRGLADGDEVAVRGVRIWESYDGPPFWFFPETGNWQWAQCDARVGYEPSLLEVFTHCAAIPGAGEVVIPRFGDHDLGTVTVRSSVTAPLGQVTDCTAADGACVLALVRMTQFGTVEAAVTPLQFA